MSSARRGPSIKSKLRPIGTGRNPRGHTAAAPGLRSQRPDPQRATTPSPLTRGRIHGRPQTRTRYPDRTGTTGARPGMVESEIRASGVAATPEPTAAGARERKLRSRDRGNEQSVERDANNSAGKKGTEYQHTEAGQRRRSVPGRAWSPWRRRRNLPVGERMQQMRVDRTQDITIAAGSGVPPPRLPHSRVRRHRAVRDTQGRARLPGRDATEPPTQRRPRFACSRTPQTHPEDDDDPCGHCQSRKERAEPHPENYDDPCGHCQSRKGRAEPHPENYDDPCGHCQSRKGRAEPHPENYDDPCGHCQSRTFQPCHWHGSCGSARIARHVEPYPGTGRACPDRVYVSFGNLCSNAASGIGSASVTSSRGMCGSMPETFARSNGWRNVDPQGTRSRSRRNREGRNPNHSPWIPLARNPLGRTRLAPRRGRINSQAL